MFKIATPKKFLLNSPQQADRSKTKNSFGLPKEWVEKLIQAAKPGTGRIDK